MKRNWLAGIAIALGCVGYSSDAYAQVYVNQGSGLAPSGYPIGGAMQPTPGPQAFTTHPPLARGWVGPQNGQYHMANWQEEVAPHPAGGMQPIPAGTGVADPYLQQAPQYAPQHAQMAPAPMGYTEQAPQMAYPAPVASYGADCNGGQYYTGESIPSSYFTGGACGPALTAPKPWFFGAGVLLFNRVDDHNVRLAFDSNLPTPDALSTQDARNGLHPGIDVFFGRYFNCGRNAIVANYWGLFPDSETASVMPSPGGNLRANMPGFQDLDMPVNTAYDWYDGAAAQRVVRNSEIHNVEINLLGFGIGGASRAGYSCGGGCGTGCGGGCNSCVGGPNGPFVPGCGSRLNLTWLAGVRFFRFQDYFEYAASQTDNIYGATADDIYYTNDVTNDLVGAQLGGYANYCLTSCLSAYVGSKFGVYGNAINADTRIGTVPAAAIIDAPNAYDGMPYNYSSSKTDIAFLGELDAGLGYSITQCWSVRAGYRALAASGIATAVGQIPYDYINVAHITDINNGDALILHGAYVGAQYNF